MKPTHKHKKAIFSNAAAADGASLKKKKPGRILQRDYSFAH